MPRTKNKLTSNAPLTTTQQLASLIKSARDIMRKDKGLSGDLDRLPMLTWIMFLKFLDDTEQLREQEARVGRKRFRPAIEPPYRWRDWAAKEEAITGNELIAFINQDEAVRPDGTKGPGLFAYLKSLQSANGADRRDVIANVFRGVINRMINGYLLRDVINKVNGIHFYSSEEIHTLGHLYETMLKEMRDAAGDSGEFYTPRPLVKFMVDVINPQLGETVLDPACGTGGFLVESYNHLEKQCKTIQHRKILQEQSIFGGEAKPLPFMLVQMNLLLHGLEYPRVEYGNSLAKPLHEIGDKDRVDIIMTNPPFGGEEEPGIRANFPDDKRTSETALLFLQLIMRKLRRTPRSRFRPSRAAVVVPNTTLFYAGVAARLRQELLRQFNLWAIVRLPKGVFEPYTDIETNVLFFDRENETSKILYYRLNPPNDRKQYSKTQPLRYEELQECLTLLQRGEDASPNAWFVKGAEILTDLKAILDLHNPKVVRTTTEQPAIVVQKLYSATHQIANSFDRIQADIHELHDLVTDQTTWSDRKLGDVLQRRKDVCDVEDGVIYKRIRIQVKGRGVKLRDECDGSKVGTKRQFVVRAGQFVLSKIDARNGAFGIVPDEADGSIITGNFWAYDVDTEAIEPKLLHYLTRSDAFINFCSISSPGATNRRYLQENLFLEQVVRIPALPIQQTICELLCRIEAVSFVAERDLMALSKRSPALLQSALHTVFGGEARILDDDAVEEPKEVELEAAE